MKSLNQKMGMFYNMKINKLEIKTVKSINYLPHNIPNINTNGKLPNSRTTTDMFKNTE